MPRAARGCAGRPARCIRSGDGAAAGERGPGALQRALDRRHADVQHRRDLGGGEREDLPQQQHGPLPGGQVLQPGHEREPHPFPGQDLGLRIGADERGRDRLDPGSGFGSGHGVRRQRPPAPAGEGGQADVGDDPVEPHPHRRPLLERRPGPERPQVCLLNGVLGLVPRAEHAIAVREQPTAFPLEPFGQRRRAGAVHACAPDHCSFGHVRVDRARPPKESHPSSTRSGPLP